MAEENVDPGGSDGTPHERDPTNCKVGRVLVEYGFEEFGDELVRLWTDEGDERYSLRELADLFNQRLLRAAMRDAGLTPLDGEVENLHRLLTDDETSAGMRTQAETTLRRDGISPEELSRDFVSHQAIHTYLTKYRDAESPTEETDPVESAMRVHGRLQSRLKAVIENNLRTLRETGRIALGSFTVSIEVRVFCEDCGTQRGVGELLRVGGCECEPTTDRRGDAPSREE